MVDPLGERRGRRGVGGGVSGGSIICCQRPPTSSKAMRIKVIDLRLPPTHAVKGTAENFHGIG